MFLDFYAGTFYSMITKYKKKHNLLLEDQTEYYFESLFLLTVQAIFCICVLNSIAWETVLDYHSDFFINLALFFVTLILHFASVCPVRNGIQMCRYTVFHYDQLTHPIAAFMLGIFVIFVNVLCEVTNVMYLLTQNSVSDVISKFVAFKVLIQVNTFYNAQRINFSIKKEIAASPLVIIEDNRKIFGKKADKSSEVQEDEKKQELIDNNGDMKRKDT